MNMKDNRNFKSYLLRILFSKPEMLKTNKRWIEGEENVDRCHREIPEVGR
jgi:hypothetical protein